MNIREITYCGVKCAELTEKELKAIVTVEVGPRIIFFGKKSGKNMLAELTGDFEKKGTKEFAGYGGHRLWTSPEDPVRTYEADNFPVVFEQTEMGASFTSPVDPVSQLQKTMVLNLTEFGLDIFHSVKNMGQWPIEFSCWGITQMKNGGFSVLPVNTDSTGLLPSGNLVLWPYTKLNDKRLYLGERYITLTGDANAKSPIKVGMYNTSGFAAYINDGDMFVKRFMLPEGTEYPDYCCNCESYTCDRFTEVESLAPLMKVDKGGEATGYEFWEFVENVGNIAPNDEAAIDGAIAKMMTIGEDYE